MLYYSRIANVKAVINMLKGQDIVVLAALMDESRSDESYADLGKRACLSASEAHAAVRRLQESALINSNRRVVKSNAKEFLIHGLRYAFPFRPSGKIAKGMATSYAAPVARGEFAVTGLNPVWCSYEGDEYGQAFEPLYSSVPKAAANDPKIYDCLAIFDMLRGGRLRERKFAEGKLLEILG